MQQGAVSPVLYQRHRIDTEHHSGPLFIFGFGLGTIGAAYATWIAEASVS